MPSLEKYDIAKDFTDKEIDKITTTIKIKNDLMSSIETLKEKYILIKEQETLYTDEAIKTKEEYFKNIETIKEEYLLKEKQIEFFNNNKLNLINENSKIIFDNTIEEKLKLLKQNLKVFNVNEFIELNTKQNNIKNIIETFETFNGEIKHIEESTLKELNKKIDDLELTEKENIKNIQKKESLINELKSFIELESKIIIKNDLLKEYEILKNEIETLKEYTIEKLNSFKNIKNKYENLIQYLDNSYIEELIKNIEKEENDLKKGIEEINQHKKTLEEENKNNILKIEKSKTLNEDIIKLKDKIKISKNFTIENLEKLKDSLLKVEININEINNKNNILNNIGEMKTCPTCLQEIDDNHKKHLTTDTKIYEVLLSNKKGILNEIKLMEEDLELQKNNSVIEIELKGKLLELENINKIEIKDITKINKNIESLELKIKNKEMNIKEMNIINNYIIDINSQINIELDYFNIYKIKPLSINLFLNIENLLINLKEETEKISNIIENYENKINHKTLIEKNFELKNRDVEENKKNNILKEEYKTKIKIIELELKNIIIINIEKNLINNLKKEKVELEKDLLYFNTFMKYENSIKDLNIISFNTFEKLNEELKKANFKTSVEYDKYSKEKIEFEKQQNEIIELEKLNLVETNKLQKMNSNNEQLKQIEIEILKIVLPKFIKEEYNKEKLEYDQFMQEYKKYSINKAELEKQYEMYIALEKEIELLEEDLFQWKKLKTYSERIKKAVITETFAKITNLANIILKNEGTISLEIAINHVNDRKFEIIVKDKTSSNIIKDISLLSGAEKMTVSKALNLALAQSTNFKTLWLDESDGSLSPQNKSMFVDILKNLFKIMDLDEIFVISHMQEVEAMADKIYNFNDYINGYVLHKEEELNYNFDDLL
jgi:exonuclease SbcC